MTGELTLTGRVLPIGGLKEKVLGAARAGIKEIIIPIENAADLEDISDEVQQQLKFHVVENLGQVLAVALEPEEGDATPPKRAAKRKPGSRASRDPGQVSVGQ
jgi:ATP-dependent Lon protease